MDREVKKFILNLMFHLADRVLPGPVHCVQVGANDGKLADPLFPFLTDHGWHGVLIEPNPVYHARLARLHSGRDHVRALNLAASSEPGALELFYLAEEYEALYRENARGCASFARDRVLAALTKEREDANAHIARIDVPVQTLDRILADAGVAQTDVLVIDTEGHEPEVLAGCTLSALRPKIAMVEVNERAKWKGVLPPLEAAGYRCFRHMQEIIAVSPEFPEFSLEALFGAAGVLDLGAVKKG